MCTIASLHTFLLNIRHYHNMQINDANKRAKCKLTWHMTWDKHIDDCEPIVTWNQIWWNKPVGGIQYYNNHRTCNIPFTWDQMITPQKTEDWTFCPVLQLFCLMNVSLYWLLCDSTLLLRVLAVLGLYATSSLFVIIIIIIIIITSDGVSW